MTSHSTKRVPGGKVLVKIEHPTLIAWIEHEAERSFDNNTAIVRRAVVAAMEAAIEAGTWELPK